MLKISVSLMNIFPAKYGRLVYMSMALLRTMLLQWTYCRNVTMEGEEERVRDKREGERKIEYGRRVFLLFLG